MCDCDLLSVDSVFLAFLITKTDVVSTRSSLMLVKTSVWLYRHSFGLCQRCACVCVCVFDVLEKFSLKVISLNQRGFKNAVYALAELNLLFYVRWCACVCVCVCPV